MSSTFLSHHCRHSRVITTYTGGLALGMARLMPIRYTYTRWFQRRNVAEHISSSPWEFPCSSTLKLPLLYGGRFHFHVLLGTSRISLCWIGAFRLRVEFQKILVTSSQQEGWTKAIGSKNLKTGQRGVWAWSDLSMLRGSVTLQDPRGGPSAHISREHWARHRRSAVTVGAKKRREEIKWWREVRWGSVLRKRLALKGRGRCKQTRVEHAGHVVALACVYTPTPRSWDPGYCCRFPPLGVYLRPS